MRVLDPGHIYEPDVYDGHETQRIVFMKREGEKYPGNKGHYSGTNCQEVIRILIDRIKYLNNQVPCTENDIILQGLRDALYGLEVRAARRHNRLATLVLDQEIESQSYCHQCGHIGCVTHTGET